MKKYLRLLYIALFAMISVSLTACGDDDDEPDNSSNSSTFTIDGESYGIHSITGAKPVYTDYSGINGIQANIDVEVYPSSSSEYNIYPIVNFRIDVESTDLTKGAKLNLLGGWLRYMTGFMEYTTFRDVSSGSIYVKEITSSTITLDFQRVKLSNDNSYKILNGTLTLDYIKY